MIKRFLISLQFLTAIPISIREAPEPEDFGKSLLYFPLAGLLIGGILSLASILLAFLPPPVKASIIIVLGVLLTGGLHLDGFADACDGFFGHNPRERILEIMKDSRIGVMGAAGISALLLFKFSSYAAIPEGTLWKALIASAVFSRWAQTAACLGAPYAREDGKGRHFAEYASIREVLPGFLFSLLLSVFLFNLKGLAVFFASAIPVFISFFYMKHRIGGVTGDTVGALSEISEVSVLFFTLVFV